MFKLILMAVIVSICLAIPFNERIVGGEPVAIEEHPYQAAIRYDGLYSCGGVIIGPKWILTSGRCSDRTYPVHLKVRAGSSSPAGGISMAVARIHEHPNYTDATMDYDISLLELKSELVFYEKIQPIRLASSDDDVPVGSDAYLTGFGKFGENEIGPVNILHGVNLKIVSRSECEQAYYGKITERMFCAGVDGGGKGFCNKDYGSPLVVGETLVGIVSWSTGCARPNYPGIYTNVANLRNFIKEVSGI